FLQKKWQVCVEERGQLRARLAQKEEHHRSQVQSLTEAHTLEEEQRLKVALERCEQKGQEALCQAVEEARQSEAARHAETVRSSDEKVEQLNTTISKLRELITTKDHQTHTKLEEVNKVMSELEHLKVCNSQLSDQLEAATKDHECQKEQLNADISRIRSQNEVEVCEFKEQIKQHSITICCLEEKLQKARKLNEEYSQRLNQLQKDLHKERTSVPSSLPLPQPAQVIVQKPAQHVLDLEKEVTTRRAESLQLKNVLQEKDQIIIQQRLELSQALARLSDMAGELSEENKEELEQSREVMERHEREMERQRQQHASMSEMIECQKGDILRLHKQLQCMREEAEAAAAAAAAASGKSSSSSSDNSSDNSNNNMAEQISFLRNYIKQREGEWSRERIMAKLDEKCGSEKTSEDSNNKTQVSNPAKCSVYEAGRENFPHQEQILLIKPQTGSAVLHKDQNQNNSNAGHHCRSSMCCEAEIERNSHRDTLMALEASEISCLSMLKNLLSVLELRGNSGLQSIAHVSHDKRNHIVKNRKDISQRILQKIQNIQQHLEQKEKLLQDYEADLTKLRKAEEVAVRKVNQADNLTKAMVLKTEETNLLRESLTKTRLQLQQEKRLNSAIKQRKIISPAGHCRRETGHHHPFPSRRSSTDSQLSQKLPKVEGGSSSGGGNSSMKNLKREKLMKNRRTT
ncbi:forkhead-associated domain-containing protein 1-like, partial [Argonauta hians]